MDGQHKTLDPTQRDFSGQWDGEYIYLFISVKRTNLWKWVDQDWGWLKNQYRWRGKMNVSWLSTTLLHYKFAFDNTISGEGEWMHSKIGSLYRLSYRTSHVQTVITLWNWTGYVFVGPKSISFSMEKVTVLCKRNLEIFPILFCFHAQTLVWSTKE